MAFRKMQRPKYPPRLWSLVGYPGSGKSTFASQMNGPLLVIDADHRFTEVLDESSNEVYDLSDIPSDHVNPDRINALLAKNMPGSDVRTVVVDSLTAIITPLVVQAMMDREENRSKNLVAGFRHKALAMRQLQDAVTRWGTDVLWIYHLQKSRDDKARETERATVSETELARLTRSINLQLQVVQEGTRRGVQVVWARRGRSGLTVWDDTGNWAGMPEKVEAAVYDGLSKAEQDAIEQETPSTFPNPETAISWGFEQGAYESLEKARAAYEQVKQTRKPRSAKEMGLVWVETVEEILAKIPAVVAEQAPPNPEEDEDAVF
jgi:adenylate kinase family enzyme